MIGILQIGVLQDVFFHDDSFTFLIRPEIETKRTPSIMSRLKDDLKKDFYFEEQCELGFLLQHTLKLPFPGDCFSIFYFELIRI